MVKYILIEYLEPAACSPGSAPYPARLPGGKVFTRGDPVHTMQIVRAITGAKGGTKLLHLRNFLPVIALGVMISIATAVHAASATDYAAIRAKTTIMPLQPTDQLSSLFPGHAGQAIEVEGIVSGIFTSGSSTGFLLQVDPHQTLIFTARQPDPDIALANRLRVLGNIPTAGTVLDAVALTRLNVIAATSTTNPDSSLTPPSTMPVEHRPPVYFFPGTRSDIAGSYGASGAGLAQRPEVVQRYMQKIKAYNGHISDDVAQTIAFNILDKSEKYNVDPRLTMALIAQESRFNPNAVSHVGARGLGQLMPYTAEVLGVHNSFDISENLDGSVRYLRDQLQTFGNISLALAAYNAGPKSVKRYGGVPPYRETQNYVQVIWANYNYISTEMVN